MKARCRLGFSQAECKGQGPRQQDQSGVEMPHEISACLFGLEKNLLNDLVSQNLKNVHCKPNKKNSVQEMAAYKQLLRKVQVNVLRKCSHWSMQYVVKMEGMGPEAGNSCLSGLCRQRLWEIPDCPSRSAQGHTPKKPFELLLL